jgi:hypothetical protein
MLITLSEALAWLNDPPYSLPGFHGPRMVCGTCKPAIPEVTVDRAAPKREVMT